MKKYNVKGMTCIMCSNSIEKEAKSFAHISEVYMNFASETLSIKTEASFDEASFLDHIAKLGYKLIPMQAGLVSQNIKISGMTCTMCAKAIETNLKDKAGVVEVNINFASEALSIKYNSDIISYKTIEDTIISLGYKVIKQKETKDKEKPRLIVSLILGFILFFVSMGPMVGIKFPQFMDMDASPIVFATIQLTLALSLMAIGRGFYIRGFRNLFRLSPNMDSLVALGTSAAFIYSIYSYIRILSGHNEAVHMLYFEATGVIIALILLGKFLESRSKGRAKEALDRLAKLAPEFASLKRGDKIEEVLVKNLAVGDLIIVKAGEQVPIDGIVVEGRAAVDEAMLTGESLPVEKEVGSQVVGASICRTGYLVVEVSSVGGDTVLAKMIELVEQAQNSKAPIARLADKVSGIFVPIVLGISIISFIIWYLVTKDFFISIQILVSVLVIACPCSLGLATPIAIIVGTGVGSSHGILLKNAEVLEETHKLKAIALDKTGTITSGIISVVDIFCNSKMTKEQLLKIMASLEVTSSHPLAQAVVEEANKYKLSLLKTEDYTVYEGMGIGATINKKSYLLGNERLINQKSNLNYFKEAIKEQKEKGYSLIFLAEEDEVVGFLSLADTIKESSYEAVKQIQKMGLEVILISGDHASASKEVAKKLGINEVYSEVLPHQKGEIIKKLQEKYTKVAMVGDGINDSVALASSDIGIALASGTQIAMASSDIVLMKSDLRDVALAIYLSKKTIKNIKENLFWAFFYNIIGIPLAAGLLYPLFSILLDPMIAALAMAFSSVSVVLNALRLKRVSLDKKTK